MARVRMCARRRRWSRALWLAAVLRASVAMSAAGAVESGAVTAVGVEKGAVAAAGAERSAAVAAGAERSAAAAVGARNLWVEVRINGIPQADFALLHIDLRGHLLVQGEVIRAWHLRPRGSSAEVETEVRI